MKKKVMFVVNNSNFFISHRLPIGKKLLEDGSDIYILSPDPSSLLSEQGFHCIKINMSRKGINPIQEFRIIYSLYKIFKKIKPDLIHLITIKPYLYGGIAARLAKVPAVVTAVAGLGILFSKNTYKEKILRSLLFPLFKFAFSHPNQKVIFQNTYDQDSLLKWSVLDENKTVLICGSGANLEEYSYLPEPEGIPVISFAARLLRDKGVVEFVEAARLLKSRGVNAEFWLIGEPDPGNPNTVTKEELDEWEKQGTIRYLGFRKDIANLFSKSHIITLPSYYGEGLPKVLIEAAACGRAVITTDHPGCRDAVSRESGLLVPIKDSEGLAEQIEYLIRNPEIRRSMGLAGRKLAEEEFSIEKVVEQHMRIYQNLL